MGRQWVALTGALLLSAVGGAVAGNATVAAMASGRGYAPPSDGTEIAAIAQSIPDEPHEQLATCADCTDRTGLSATIRPASFQRTAEDRLSD